MFYIYLFFVYLLSFVYDKPTVNFWVFCLISLLVGIRIMMAEKK